MFCFKIILVFACTLNVISKFTNSVVKRSLYVVWGTTSLPQKVPKCLSQHQPWAVMRHFCLLKTHWNMVTLYLPNWQLKNRVSCVWESFKVKAWRSLPKSVQYNQISFNFCWHFISNIYEIYLQALIINLLFINTTKAQNLVWFYWCKHVLSMILYFHVSRAWLMTFLFKRIVNNWRLVTRFSFTKETLWET